MFILSCLLSINLYCREVQAEAHIDSTSILIGDQVTLTLKITADQGTKVVFPNIESPIGSFEIISTGKIDTVLANGAATLSRAYVITCFDSGSYTIPPFTFMYEKKGMGELYPAQTKPIAMNVTNPKLGNDIIDIKPPLEEPYDFWEYFPYILALLLIAAAAFVILRYLKHRKPAGKTIAVVKTEPKIPAHILAVAALDKLQSDRLWQKGEIKEHYIILTDIIRTYIERRFSIDALEMTSEEIMSAMRKILNNGEALEQLDYILENADMTKFAKERPEESINERTMKYSYNFINISKEPEQKTEAGN